jgi:hypothetical protein
VPSGRLNAYARLEQVAEVRPPTIRPGDMTAALAAGELVDVAVRRAKMAPTAAALIHLPTEELHTGRLQLPHGAGEILDHKADQGPVAKCSWSWSLGPKTSKVPPSGSWKAAKSEASWLVVNPRTVWRNATMAGYSLVLVPAHPMRLTRILALLWSGAWHPRSCHVAAAVVGGR